MDYRIGSFGQRAVPRGINFPFTSVRDNDAIRGVGSDMDDTSGKFALVMLRTNQVRVHHKRTKHEYVFRISGDQIELGECALYPNHAALIDPRTFREQAHAAAEWFVANRSGTPTTVLDPRPKSGWVAA